MTTFTNFTEEMTTKKATVKISQKNKFLRDQKYWTYTNFFGEVPHFPKYK